MAGSTRSSKGVLTAEEAEKVAVSYSPRKFPAVVTKTAVEFHAFNGGDVAGFRIDKLVAEQTGIAELERLSIEERVEREALTRLKDLQEQAYQEAYQLGFDEGRDKAFQEKKIEIEERLSGFDELLNSIGRMKLDLVSINETQIMTLIFYIGKRLAMDEITARPELVLNCVQQAVASAQSEENITLRVAPSDLEFIESVKEKLGKELESIKHAKIEASDDITSGGCVVETNYGDVNATLEQRVQRLWDAISEKLPKIKNVVGG